MAQNDQKFHLSQSAFQEPDRIWLWFLVHMCKMIISPASLFSFSKFWAKNDQKVPISVHHTPYLKNCRSYHQEFWYASVKCFLQVFYFILPKSWFFGYYWGTKKHKMVHLRNCMWIISWFLSCPPRPKRCLNWNICRQKT